MTGKNSYRKSQQKKLFQKVLNLMSQIMKPVVNCFVLNRNKN